MISKEKPSDFNPEFEVAGVFIEHEGKILFLLRHPDKPYGNLWNLPAGKVEQGETLEETAIREAGEETGIQLKITDLREKRTYFSKYPEYDYFYHTFKATVNSSNVAPKDDEVVDYGWYTPEEGLKLNTVPDEDYCIIDAYNLSSNSSQEENL